jgi:hypothetical protein
MPRGNTVSTTRATSTVRSGRTDTADTSIDVRPVFASRSERVVISILGGDVVKNLQERPVATEDEDGVLASLAPRERMRFLARRNPGELALLILSFIAGIYIVIRSLIGLGINLVNLVIASAHAEQNSFYGITSFHDPFDWYVGLLMGIALLFSLSLIGFSKTASKISFGKDISKIILGFIVGFLSGTKIH